MKSFPAVYLNKPVGKAENTFIRITAFVYVPILILLGTAWFLFNGECSGEVLVDSFSWMQRACEHPNSSNLDLIIWALWIQMTIASGMAIAVIKRRSTYYITMLLVALQSIYLSFAYIFYHLGQDTAWKYKLALMLMIGISFYFMTVIHRKTKF